MELFSGDGVEEGEPPGVEEETGSGELVFFPVDGIAEDGGADVVEVDADLVGAAGVEVAEDQGGLGGWIRGEGFVIGDGGLAPGRVYDGHFLTVHGVASDVGEDGFRGGLWDAVGNGKVELFHGRALCELSDETLVGGVGFCDDEAAGCVLVEAVDDAGALDSTDAGELAFAVMEEGVYEGAVGVSRGGMDYDAVLFVEHEDVLVFI